MEIQSLTRIVLAGAAALSLAACAYDSGHRGNYSSMGVNYQGYYDGHYGQINDGYWGPDGAFYYTDAPGHPFRRDDEHHVRRDAADGFNPIHGYHEGSVNDDGNGR